MSSNTLLAPVPGENGRANGTPEGQKTFYPKHMKHWWEATFNCGLLKSKQFLDALNAEVGTRKGKALRECQTMHKDGLEVFDSSALSAAAQAAAE